MCTKQKLFQPPVEFENEIVLFLTGKNIPKIN